jgi:hypothetical protein
MWPFKFVDEDKERQIEDLMDERDDLRDRLQSIEKSRNPFNQVFEQLYASSFAFDWEKGQAFSIERIHEWSTEIYMHIPITVIGYHKQDGDKQVIGEWKFYCSQKEHDRLVEEFNTRSAQK